MNLFPEIEEEVLVQEEVTIDSHELVVFNDDVNTFDNVIEALIEICEHTPEQAEQCTLIIHYKGKCTVKEGEFEKLKPMCDSILDRGIQANIQ